MFSTNTSYQFFVRLEFREKIPLKRAATVWANTGVKEDMFPSSMAGVIMKCTEHKRGPIHSP
jgi:hypothetical protein